MAAPPPPPMHNTFQAIKVHTAKCDECNKHNVETIYRCTDCSQQCCTPCWNKKGGDGVHLTGSIPLTPVIVDQQHWKKSNMLSKKTVKQNKKKLARKLAKAKSEIAVKEEENASDAMEDEASDVVTPAAKTSTPHKKQVQTSGKKTITGDGDADSDDSELQSIPVSKKIVKEGKEPAVSPISLVKAGTENSDTGLSKKPTVTKKRRHSTIDEDDELTKSMFEHAAREGRKRIRTGSESTTSVKSSLPYQASAEEEPRTEDYANYLIQLSRGEPAEHPSSGLRQEFLTSPASDSDDKLPTERQLNAATEFARSPVRKIRRPALTGIGGANRPVITLSDSRSQTAVSSGDGSIPRVLAKGQSKAKDVLPARDDNVDIDQPTSRPVLQSTRQSHGIIDLEQSPSSDNRVNHRSGLQKQSIEITQTQAATADKSSKIMSTETTKKTTETGNTDFAKRIASGPIKPLEKIVGRVDTEFALVEGHKQHPRS